MAKKQKKKRHPQRPRSPRMLGGFEAARRSPDRQIPWWPVLDATHEVDAADLYSLWVTARYLYANSPEVAMAVQSIASLCGWLMPLPVTEDAEWNTLARAAFLRRALNRNLFDASRKLTWKSSQLWMESRAVIDGDALCVLGRGDDGGARIAFYSAPQIWGDDSQKSMVNGVYLGAQGEALGYNLTDEARQQSVFVPAGSAILYQHRPDPARPRGYSELASALTNIQDVKEINAFNKISIKNAASFALFEEKQMDDPRAAQASLWQQRKAAQGAGNQASVGAAESSLSDQVAINGVKMVSLAPGRKATLLHDTRPSNENQEFVKRLVSSLAYAVGLDPQVLFFTADMNSASTRFSLQKFKLWREGRLLEREAWANMVYQHVIACEIAAGRLRPCRAAAWQNVYWVSGADLTIDKGREVTGTINLIREGLADADAWTLATDGMTVKQILERRAANMAYAREIAAQYGVSGESLLPGALGAAVPLGTDAGDGAAAPAPLPDPEPEA